MAGTSTSDADSFMCPVCLEPYTDPKSLSCGHSMCAQCSNRMINDAKMRRRVLGIQGNNHLGFRDYPIELECPICRRKTAVPYGGLPTNYMLQEVLTQFSQMKTNERQQKSNWKLCVSCQETQPQESFWHCKQCGERGSNAENMPVWFCATCGLKYHNGHRIVSMNELKEQQSSALTKLTEIEQHCRSEIQKVADNETSVNDVLRNMHSTLTDLLGSNMSQLRRMIECDDATALSSLDLRVRQANVLKDRIQKASSTIFQAHAQVQDMLQSTFASVLLDLNRSVDEEIEQTLDLTEADSRDNNKPTTAKRRSDMDLNNDNHRGNDEGFRFTSTAESVINSGGAAGVTNGNGPSSAASASSEAGNVIVFTGSDRSHSAPKPRIPAVRRKTKKVLPKSS